jgi:hypothetical protein
MTFIRIVRRIDVRRPRDQTQKRPSENHCLSAVTVASQLADRNEPTKSLSVRAEHRKPAGVAARAADRRPSHEFDDFVSDLLRGRAVTGHERILSAGWGAKGFANTRTASASPLRKKPQDASCPNGQNGGDGGQTDEVER